MGKKRWSKLGWPDPIVTCLFQLTLSEDKIDGMNMETCQIHIYLNALYLLNSKRCYTRQRPLHIKSIDSIEVPCTCIDCLIKRTAHCTGQCWCKRTTFDARHINHTSVTLAAGIIKCLHVLSRTLIAMYGFEKSIRQQESQGGQIQRLKVIDLQIYLKLVKVCFKLNESQSCQCP